MRALTWLAAIATLLGAAVYTALSVVRWEWNRALFFGLVFLAAEVALLGMLLLRRLDAADHGTARVSCELEALRAARKDHERFPWLVVDHRESVNRSSVFITLLVGSGVLVSGLAWLLDKLGSATTDRRREAQLAGELGEIRYPEGGILVDESTALAGGRSDAEMQRVRALTQGRGR